MHLLHSNPSQPAEDLVPARLVRCVARLIIGTPCIWAKACLSNQKMPQASLKTSFPYDEPIGTSQPVSSETLILNGCSCEAELGYMLAQSTCNDPIALRLMRANEAMPTASSNAMLLDA